MPGFGGFQSTVHTSNSGVVHGGGSRSFGSAAAVTPAVSPSSEMSSGWLNALQSQRDYNNAFNLAQVDSLNSFNASEAQKNRDWQERMSNTSYQRAVKDLMAAGLNPVLAALNGGASTPSGSHASGSRANADDTMSSGLISLMGAMMSTNSALQIAQMQIENQRWLQSNNPNSLYGFLNRILGDMSGSKASNISSMFNRSKAGLSAYYGDGSKGFLNPGQIKKGWKAFWK